MVEVEHLPRTRTCTCSFYSIEIETMLERSHTLANECPMNMLLFWNTMVGVFSFFFRNVHTFTLHTLSCHMLDGKKKNLPLCHSTLPWLGLGAWPGPPHGCNNFLIVKLPNHIPTSSTTDSGKGASGLLGQAFP